MSRRRKTEDMMMLRSAGLTLAAADRLAGTRGPRLGWLWAAAGAGVLGLAAAGVMAFNLAGGAAPEPERQVFAAGLDPVAPAPPGPVPETEPLGAFPADYPAEAITGNMEDRRPGGSPEQIAGADAAPRALSLPPLSAEPEPPELQMAQSEFPWLNAAQSTVSEAAPDCVTDLRAAYDGLTLQFDAGSADIRPEDYDALIALGRAANDCATARVRVAGHSDSSGSDAINLSLSWARADSTINILDTLGVDVAQFEAMGFGARLPLAQGSDDEDALNRRVEFQILREEDQP